jgi:hypothetical protein
VDPYIHAPIRLNGVVKKERKSEEKQRERNEE